MKRLAYRSSAGMSLADLLVVVVMIPLLVVAFIGCRQQQRIGDGRLKCASGLKSIGQALMLYANENKQQYPRTVYQPGATVTPTWGTGATAADPFGPGGPQPNDVSAALFLLARTQDVSPELFVCPSSSVEMWDFDGGGNTAANWSNWNGVAGIQKNLSYSMQNPYPDDNAAKNFKWNTSLSSEYAVAADINPGVIGSGQNVLAVRSTDTGATLKQGNSPNHGGDGQNILFGDGHVDFRTSAFAGINGDNIYARRAASTGDASSSVQNSPYDADDNVLLPTDD